MKARELTTSPTTAILTEVAMGKRLDEEEGEEPEWINRVGAWNHALNIAYLPALWTPDYAPTNNPPSLTSLHDDLFLHRLIDVDLFAW